MVLRFSTTQKRMLIGLCSVAFGVLGVRVLAGILFQYQWYFPANFREASFLVGRQEFFRGIYRTSFYVHVVCGPLVLMLAMFLLWSGRRQEKFTGARTVGLHRWIGKAQFVLVAMLLAPSGLVMATRAHTGIVAGVGFAILSIMTLVAAVLAVHFIKRSDIGRHRLWANRLVLLLLSPIFLRVINNAAKVAGLDAIGAYQFSAWASWLVPLIAFEVWVRFKDANEIRMNQVEKQNLDLQRKVIQ